MGKINAMDYVTERYKEFEGHRYNLLYHFLLASISFWVIKTSLGKYLLVVQVGFTSIFFSMYFRLGQHKIFNICPFEFCPENKDNKVFNLSIV